MIVVVIGATTDTACCFSDKSSLPKLTSNHNEMGDAKPTKNRWFAHASIVGALAT